MRELFNQVDIDANRQSKLSPAQVEFIKASANPTVWIWGTVICLGLGVLSGLLFISMDAAGAVGVLGPILGVVLVFCAVRWATIWNLRRKLLRDQVVAAEGTITFKKLDLFDQLRYSPETMDGKRLFPQGLAGLSVMLPPGDYRFYYLPTRKWLLSSEPLSSETELKANMVEVLGGVFGFNPGDLENLRAQAATGEVKTVEGQPRIDTSSSNESGLPAKVYATIGEVQFMIPQAAAFAFINAAPLSRILL